MSTNIIQTSFASGELAPSIFARVDLTKYHSGAALLRNFFVDYRSGASTRFGSKFIIQAFNSAKQVRLIPFQFSVVATYVLEFGDFYIRFISNGGAVLETGFAITAATNGSPGVVTAAGNNFVNGDWAYISGVVGATGYNGLFVSVQVTGAALTLYDVNGNPINASTYGTYLSGGTIARVYKIASPYAAADLALLKFTQSASVLTISHPSYATQNLTRTAPTTWTITPLPIGTVAVAPTGLAGTASAAGTANYAYQITTVLSNGDESTPSASAAVAAAVNIGTTAGTISLTWNAAAVFDHYNIYKAELVIGGAVPAGTAFGYIGTATGTSFADSNIVPDYSITPPLPQNPFSGTNFPGVPTYFNQRLTLLSSTSLPLNFWMSQPGIFSNFNISSPSQADDAITGLLVSTQVNAIKSAIPMSQGLIALTAKGAWLISGQGGVLSPTTIQAVPQAYNGASDVPPIVSNNDILYVQAKGSIVRDLSFNIYANIYTGNDISVLSNHLFTGYTISEWAYAEEPYKIVWAVRNDGVLLSLTFVKEQEIIGWSRSDTLGTYQSVASITEGSVDAVYVVVKRLVGGQWLQYIERFADRNFTYGAEDAWCVDAGVQSVLPTPAANLLMSSSTGTCTFTADANVFSLGNVNSILRADSGIATITTYVSPTQLIGTWTQSPTMTLPNDPNATPLPVTSGNWSLTVPSITFSGLDHLNGQTVSILADGGVVTPQVVAGGKITLPKAATKVTAGLPFTPQLKTMPLEVGNAQDTSQGKRKSISGLTIKVVNTRGLYIGESFDSNDLVPAKELFSTTPLDQPSPLITGDEYFITGPSWNVPGQLCFQITDPLPATILGVVPEITIGDNTK